MVLVWFALLGWSVRWLLGGWRAFEMGGQLKMQLDQSMVADYSLARIDEGHPSRLGTVGVTQM